MENITELVRCRRSVRTFDGKEINEDDRKKLALFMEKVENPYGIPVSFKFLDGKKERLPCPVVSGTDLYVGAKVPHMPGLLGLARSGLAALWIVLLLSVRLFWNRMKGCSV